MGRFRPFIFRTSHTEQQNSKIPTGGTSGQVLKKNSSADYDMSWDDQSGGGGGGTTVTFFQVQDDASTGQLTTGTPADLAGIWTTPSLTDSDFSWNGTTGELTINTAGTLELNIQVTSWNNANNRHELKANLLRDTGGGYSTLTGSTNYASRNNTQDEGGTWIPGYIVSVDSGDKIKVQVYDIGVAATIGDSNVGGQTYISAKLYT